MTKLEVVNHNMVRVFTRSDALAEGSSSGTYRSVCAVEGGSAGTQSRGGQLELPKFCMMNKSREQFSCQTV